MKAIRYILAAALLSGCGGGGGGSSAASGGGAGGGGGGGDTGSPWPSYSVASSSDLPTCPSTNITGRIYYVEADENFQACRSTGWTVINTGTYIVSNRRINSSTMDWCTEVTGESCFFTGGQVVKYSDGTISIQGMFSWLSIIGSDSDTELNSNAFVLPPGGASASITMSPYVARGAGYRVLWLVYSRSADSFSLIHDTNNNGSPGAGDTTLATLTVSDW